jgi:hypothetical protein
MLKGISYGFAEHPPWGYNTPRGGVVPPLANGGCRKLERPGPGGAVDMGSAFWKWWDEALLDDGPGGICEGMRYRSMEHLTAGMAQPVRQVAKRPQPRAQGWPSHLHAGLRGEFQCRPAVGCRGDPAPPAKSSPREVHLMGGLTWRNRPRRSC